MQNDGSPEARALEEAFFLYENEKLQESLREMRVLEGVSGMLAEVCGLSDASLLKNLEAAGVSPARAAALTLVPLVLAAWADGSVKYEERVVLLRSLDKILFFQTIDRDVLETWLTMQPPPSLTEAWEAYARTVAAKLDAENRRKLSEAVLARVKAVAEAGRILGLGGISAAESAMVRRIAGALV